MARSILAALFCAAGCATGAARDPIALDLLPAFSAEVCAGDSAGVYERWLAHETLYWADYESLIYETPALAQLRAQSWALQADDADGICARAEAFAARFAPLAQEERVRVAALVGVSPRAEFRLIAPILLTDARTLQRDGVRVIVLNAVHPALADGNHLRRLVGHEWLHAAQAALHGEADAMGPFEGALYREGMAAFGETALFGGAPMAVGAREAAYDARFAEVMENLRAQSAAERDAHAGQFFEGGAGGTLPDRFGYYLGMRIFQTIAAEEGARGALRTGPAAFQARWRAFLEAEGG